jgi:hypothetical protein
MVGWELSRKATALHGESRQTSLWSFVSIESRPTDSEGYIPKGSDPARLRSLGISTLTDRAMRALYLLGFDPIEESTADANSYRFRSLRARTSSTSVKP